MSEVLGKVCKIVRLQLGLKDSDPLGPSTTFDDVWCDSLDSIEIVMALEEEFEIEVADDEWRKVRSIADVCSIIEKWTA